MNKTALNKTLLHELNAKYIKFLKLQDSIMKQKTQLQWLKEGHTNFKYFHSLIRGRRRIHFIHKIIDEYREWLQRNDTIAKDSYDHFHQIFTGEDKAINENNLECIYKDGKLG